RDCDWLRPSNTKEPERPGSDCMVGRRLRRWCDRGPAVKPVGEPDAGNPPVRFDEREVETEHGMRLLRHARENPDPEYAEAYPTAPPLDSTRNPPESPDSHRILA